MKNFWKIVGATAIGATLASIVVAMLKFSVISGLMAGMATTASKATSVPDNAILTIDLEGLNITEQTVLEKPLNFGAMSSGKMDETVDLGILDATLALEAAAGDPKIKALYLRPDFASGVAHLEELRSAIVKFRESGKPVVTYMERPTNGGFYLGSVADRIYMSKYHGGMNYLIGLNGRLIFLKDLLDKVGVNYQLIRHGKYKAAGEMYIRNSASPENIEQTSAYVNTTWNEMVAPMAERFNMTPAQFNAMIDNLELAEPEDFVTKGLVDELVSLDAMKAKLAAMGGVESYEKVASIGLADYAALSVKPNLAAKEKIAIIYTDGQIIDGRELEEVAGKRFADIIDKVRKDDDIKAVVLRVNSPGGSVSAASQIKDALDELAKTKPIVASYGEYAASGGYWISANASHIFSDATTLTGSIGVFGMIPEFSKTARNLLHINVTSVPSNKHSDMYGSMRPLSSEEVAYVQKDIEYIYKEFTSLVAEGRDMTVEAVDELGQGRVWVGRDALNNGLVDTIGGLKEALDYTAQAAGCVDYQVVSYPEPLTLKDQLMSMMNPSTDNYLVEGFGFATPAVKFLRSIGDLKEPAIYARMPFEIERLQ